MIFVSLQTAYYDAYQSDLNPLNSLPQQLPNISFKGAILDPLLDLNLQAYYFMLINDLC